MPSMHIYAKKIDMKTSNVVDFMSLCIDWTDLGIDMCCENVCGMASNRHPALLPTTLLVANQRDKNNQRKEFTYFYGTSVMLHKQV